MNVLLIFIDGLGIGRRAPENPLYLLGDEALPLAVFDDEATRETADGMIVVPTDACLGVEGRPQSASGQTTILTGVNAPQLLGFHKQGFPNARLREVIEEHSIFLQLRRARVAPNIFTNAYTSGFFEQRPRWVSATTVAVEAAGMDFRRLEDLHGGRALFHDFTNRLLIERGVQAPLRTPEEAGAILARIAQEHRFTLYEYFITDRIGHNQDGRLALHILAELARFVRTVIEKIDLQSTTVIVTSDHGNIEDLSVRNHTLNRVPTLAWGAQRETVLRGVRTLADITPTIIKILTEAV